MSDTFYKETFVGFQGDTRKRLLVFKEILGDLQFPNKNLFGDIITGFR